MQIQIGEPIESITDNATEYTCAVKLPVIGLNHSSVSCVTRACDVMRDAWRSLHRPFATVVRTSVFSLSRRCTNILESLLVLDRQSYEQKNELFQTRKNEYDYHSVSAVAIENLELIHEGSPEHSRVGRTTVIVATRAVRKNKGTKQKRRRETQSSTYEPGLSTPSHPSAMSRSLNRHPSAGQGHLHTIHPTYPRSTPYPLST